MAKCVLGLCTESTCAKSAVVTVALRPLSASLLAVGSVPGFVSQNYCESIRFFSKDDSSLTEISGIISPLGFQKQMEK